MSKFDDIINILKQDSGVIIPCPAGDEDIDECQEDLKKLELEPLPQGYIGFLKIHNGLAWDGIEFYSTDIVAEAASPDGYKLMDIVTMNDEFNDRYELDFKVLLGRSDTDYYTYDTTTGKYEILEFESRETMDEFDNFWDLFDFVIGGKLGILSTNYTN